MHASPIVSRRMAELHRHEREAAAARWQMASSHHSRGPHQELSPVTKLHVAAFVAVAAILSQLSGVGR